MVEIFELISFTSQLSSCFCIHSVITVSCASLAAVGVEAESWNPRFPWWPKGVTDLVNWSCASCCLSLLNLVNFSRTWTRSFMLLFDNLWSDSHCSKYDYKLLTSLLIVHVFEYGHMLDGYNWSIFLVNLNCYYRMLKETKRSSHWFLIVNCDFISFNDSRVSRSGVFVTAFTFCGWTRYVCLCVLYFSFVPSTSDRLLSCSKELDFISSHSMVTLK